MVPSNGAHELVEHRIQSADNTKLLPVQLILGATMLSAKKRIGTDAVRRQLMNLPARRHIKRNTHVAYTKTDKNKRDKTPYAVTITEWWSIVVVVTDSSGVGRRRN